MNVGAFVARHARDEIDEDDWYDAEAVGIGHGSMSS